MLRPLVIAALAALVVGVAAAPASAQTSDRTVVARDYRQQFAANLDVDPGWTGNTLTCDPGTTSDAAQDATLESVNFVRRLAGLAPVVFSDDLNRKAQAAALMAAANAAESVAPPVSWRCWSIDGYQGSQISNIALSDHLTPARVVAAYMADGGDGNTAVGHRRWLLNPFATTFGNGFTDTSNALAVIGPTDASNPSPDWVPWPSAGWFPRPLEPSGRWSLGAGTTAADFSHAQVAVFRVRRGDDVRMRTTVQPVADGPAMPTLVWDVRGRLGPGTYRVRVTGVRAAAASSYRYTVRLFDPN